MPLNELKSLRDNVGDRLTQGLPDEVVAKFAAKDESLAAVIHEAVAVVRSLEPELEAWRRGDERALVEHLTSDYVNFYGADSVNPYVPLAAQGPWVITSHGAVVHDNGGYGMLGLGHGCQPIIDAMAGNQVMANIMTSSFSHKRFSERLRREVGQRREDTPYQKFLCMNSGSEAVTVAARISDLNAAHQTAGDGPHSGKEIRFLGLRGAFHGRTDRPAQISHSCLKKYQKLASFQGRENLVSVAPNDVDGLKAAFSQAQADGYWFEAFFMEPVMGEGRPGEAVTPEFYAAARELTRQTGTLLVMDSIQAGFRTTGYLSVVDYPGFEGLEAPDMETFSKALNAGQYPLSVLAMSEGAAGLYEVGIYGNTMTANPRALDVGCKVLDTITDDLRANIRESGVLFLSRLEDLAREFPDDVEATRGTGLLMSIELNPNRRRVVGVGGIEEWCRHRGIGVIHGGTNALRFTPHFAIGEAEIELVVDVVRAALREGPRL